MKRQPVEKPDTSRADPTYWETVLQSHNLGKGRGYNPRKVGYRGTIQDLAVIEKKQFDKNSGHTRPKGRGPDN